MEVGPWTRTIEKGRLTWSNFMIHSVNRLLEGGSFDLAAMETLVNNEGENRYTRIKYDILCHQF